MNRVCQKDYQWGDCNEQVKKREFSVPMSGLRYYISSVTALQHWNFPVSIWYKYMVQVYGTKRIFPD